MRLEKLVKGEVREEVMKWLLGLPRKRVGAFSSPPAFGEQLHSGCGGSNAPSMRVLVPGLFKPDEYNHQRMVLVSLTHASQRPVGVKRLEPRGDLYCLRCGEVLL